MAEDDDSKTERPTDRRLSRAREEGDIPQSQEIKTVAMLLAITVVVWLMVPMMMGRLKAYLANFLERADSIRVGSEQELAELLGHLAANVGLVLLMPLGFLFLVGLSSSISQTGWTISTRKLVPDLGKINPLAGFGRMFSLQAVMELAKSMAKLAVVAILCGMILRPRIKELEHLPAMEMPAILEFIHNLLVHLLLAVVLVMVVIAASDWAYQRFNFMKKLRMTKQEVKDEHKQTEGDPKVKSRIRALRLQRARNRMMAAVPKADVVVTNPTHYACALRYDADSMTAPLLVAKGQNLVALKIREIAEEHKVPIVENPPLARALFATVEIDAEIPPEHYKAVAEVISYVLRLKGKLVR
ncbi:MAG TPA: flagellar biosynthesis protein FlhB [Rhodospirillaceae bacterium]|nr:flagellar biosynthesis protein FlhB [Rhodospirillaceae bacterium]